MRINEINRRGHHVNLGSGTIVEVAPNLVNGHFVPDRLLTKDGEGRPNDHGASFWVSLHPTFFEFDAKKDELNR